MTTCIRGGHQYPVENERRAYCAEHGVIVEWKTDWDLPSPTEEGSRGEHDVPVAPNAD